MEGKDILPNLTTPKGLELKESAIQEGELGIWCVDRIPKGDKFGPFEGIKIYDSKSALNPQYAWEVLDPDTRKLLYYIDASDEKAANWMRYVRCARYFEEQNIVSKQEGLEVYYAAISDIDPGEELLTWYDMTAYNESMKKKGNKKNVKKKTDEVEDVPPSKTTKGKGKTKAPEQTPASNEEEATKKSKKRKTKKDSTESAEENGTDVDDEVEDVPPSKTTKGKGKTKAPEQTTESNDEQAMKKSKKRKTKKDSTESAEENGTDVDNEVEDVPPSKTTKGKGKTKAPEQTTESNDEQAMKKSKKRKTKKDSTESAEENGTDVDNEVEDVPPSKTTKGKGKTKAPEQTTESNDEQAMKKSKKRKTKKDSTESAVENGTDVTLKIESEEKTVENENSWRKESSESSNVSDTKSHGKELESLKPCEKVVIGTKRGKKKKTKPEDVSGVDAGSDVNGDDTEINRAENDDNDCDACKAEFEGENVIKCSDSVEAETTAETSKNEIDLSLPCGVKKDEVEGDLKLQKVDVSEGTKVDIKTELNSRSVDETELQLELGSKSVDETELKIELGSKGVDELELQLELGSKSVDKTENRSESVDELELKLELNSNSVDETELKSKSVDEMELKSKSVDEKEPKPSVDDMEPKSKSVDDIELKSKSVDDMELKSKSVDDMEPKSESVDEMELKSKNNDAEKASAGDDASVDGNYDKIIPKAITVVRVSEEGLEEISDLEEIDSDTERQNKKKKGLFEFNKGISKYEVDLEANTAAAKAAFLDNLGRKTGKHAKSGDYPCKRIKRPIRINNGSKRKKWSKERWYNCKQGASKHAVDQEVAAKVSSYENRCQRTATTPLPEQEPFEDLNLSEKTFQNVPVLVSEMPVSPTKNTDLKVSVASTSKHSDDDGLQNVSTPSVMTNLGDDRSLNVSMPNAMNNSGGDGSQKVPTPSGMKNSGGDESKNVAVLKDQLESVQVEREPDSDEPLNLSIRSDSSDTEVEKKLKPNALGQLEYMTKALQPKLAAGTDTGQFGSSILRAAFTGQKIMADVPHNPPSLPQSPTSSGPMMHKSHLPPPVKPGMVFHNLTPELVKQNLFNNSRCSYGRYTPVGRGITQTVMPMTKCIPGLEQTENKCEDLSISPSKDMKSPAKLESPQKHGDGQYYQFEIQPYHHQVDNGCQVYRCDVCSGAYRHAFSLKRHFIRNHVNHKYVSDADLINCCVNIKKPTEQSTDENKKMCDMIRSAGYENEKRVNDDQISGTESESSPAKQELAQNVEKIEDNADKLSNHSNALGDSPLAKSTPHASPSFGKNENILIPSRASEANSTTSMEMKDNPQTLPKKWPGLFRCNICGTTFNELPLLTNHYLDHPSKKEGRMFTCDKCFMKFSHKQNLIRHRTTHQITATPSKSSVSIRGIPEGVQPGDIKFQCKLCPAYFLHHGYLMKHIRVMHGPKRNACAFCSKHFEKESKLEEHLRMTHDESLESNRATMVKKCPKPPADVDKNRSMTLSNRAQGYKFACTVCKKRFKEYRVMCRHRRLAHQSRAPQVLQKPPPVELIIPSPKRSHIVEDSPFFYANVARNISDNLNMYVDGKLESLGNPSVHFKVQTGSPPPGSCDTKLPRNDFWEKYNVNPEFPPKLNLTAVKKNVSSPKNFGAVATNIGVVSPRPGTQWPCTAECNQRRRKNGFKNFYADDNEDKKFICMVCKQEFNFFMDFDDHRWEVHPNVNCTHMEVEKDSYPPIFISPSFHGLLNSTDTPCEAEKVYASSFKCTKCKTEFDAINKLHEHIVSCAVKGGASSSSSSTTNGSANNLVSGYRKNQFAQMKKGFKVKHRLQHRAQLKSLAAQKAKEEKLQTKTKKQRKSRYEREQGIGYNDRGFEFNAEAELNDNGTKKKRQFFQLPYNPKKHKRRRDQTQVIDMHTCNGCRKRFKTISLLERHGRICSEKEKLKNDGAIAIPKREISSALKCKYCAKVFTYKASLRKHLMDICKVKKDMIARNMFTSEELEAEKIMIDNMAEKTYDGQVSVHSSEVGSEMTNEPEENLLLPRRIGYWRGKKRKGRKKNNGWAKIKTLKRMVPSVDGETGDRDSKSSVDLVEESMALGESAGTLSLGLLKSKSPVKNIKRNPFRRRMPIKRKFKISELLRTETELSLVPSEGAVDDGKRQRKRTFKAREQANTEMVLDDMECYVDDGAAPKKKKKRKLKSGIEGLSNTGSFSSSLDESASATLPLDNVNADPSPAIPKIRQRPGPKKGWKFAKLQAQKELSAENVPIVDGGDKNDNSIAQGPENCEVEKSADDNKDSLSAVPKERKRPGPKKGWKLAKMKMLDSPVAIPELQGDAVAVDSKKGKLTKMKTSESQVASPKVISELQVASPEVTSGSKVDSPKVQSGHVITTTDDSKEGLSPSTQQNAVGKDQVVEHVRKRPGPKKGWKLAKLGLPVTNALGNSGEDNSASVTEAQNDTVTEAQNDTVTEAQNGTSLESGVKIIKRRKRLKLGVKKRGLLSPSGVVTEGKPESQTESILVENVPADQVEVGDSNETVSLVTKKKRGPKKGWKLEKAKAAELASKEPAPEIEPALDTSTEQSVKKKRGPKKGWKLLKKKQEAGISSNTNSDAVPGKKSDVIPSPNRKVLPPTSLSPSRGTKGKGGKVPLKRGRKAAGEVVPDSPEKRVLIQRGPGKRVVKFKKAVLGPTRGRKRTIKDTDTKAKTLVKRRRIDGEGGDETIAMPSSDLVLNHLDHTDGVKVLEKHDLDSKTLGLDHEASVLMSGCLSAEVESSSGVSSGIASGSENSFEAGTGMEIAPIQL